MTEADYRENSKIDKIMKKIIDTIEATAGLDAYK